MTDLFALPYNHRPACEGGVLEEECAQLLRDFFHALRLAPQSRAGSPPCFRRREEITHEKRSFRIYLILTLLWTAGIFLHSAM